MVLPFLPLLRATQNRLMTQTVDIYRRGVQIGFNVPCRIHNNRLLAEPADPSDANMRSVMEWGFTMPIGTDCHVGDRLICGSIDVIAGEALSTDTWATAVRVWATRPREVTAYMEMTFYRGNSVDASMIALGPYTVRLVYDRNQPAETPVRYTPAAHSQNKGGWFIGDLSFGVQPGDRFMLDGYGGVITEVLPKQPQHIEAKFIFDEGGPR
jgi:hypothetical protein